MLIRFEVHGGRVKSIVFHPFRDWILCGLHSGIIQIWNYNIGTLIERYDEHEGPVRSVDFHYSQPLFVSGGDDTLIRVWNYDFHRCIFSLSGHLDYVRTVQFHRIQPWILSASDDTTIRLWNWQSRACIAIVPGHHHYVMSAQFHSDSEFPLFVSASLDNTIRVWNYSGLFAHQGQQINQLSQNIFGSNDVELLCEISRHSEGVNWACFHPEKLIILSASDDRTVGWTLINSYGDTVSTKTFSQHNKSVTCVALSNYQIISCGEDQKVTVTTNFYSHFIALQPGHGRFWTLASHPTKKLIAAGHDTGFLVFKLFHERPAMILHAKNLFLIDNDQFSSYDFHSDTLKSLAVSSQISGCRYLTSAPHSDIICGWSANSGGQACIFRLNGNVQPTILSEIKHVVAYGGDKIIVLTSKYEMKLWHITDTGVTNARVLKTPISYKALYPGPPGFILCNSEKAICLYQVATESVVAEYGIENVRSIGWDAKFEKVFFQRQHHIYVLDRQLKLLSGTKEPLFRIKSVIFHETMNAILYSTQQIIKFFDLTLNETIILGSVPDSVYLIRAQMNNYWYISRSMKIHQVAIQSLEFFLKLALEKSNFKVVAEYIANTRIYGESMVNFFVKHGHPDIALHLTTNPLTIFYLALDAGDISIAEKILSDLPNAPPILFSLLSKLALRSGQLSTSINMEKNPLKKALRQFISGDRVSLGELSQATHPIWHSCMNITEMSYDSHDHSDHQMSIVDTNVILNSPKGGWSPHENLQLQISLWAGLKGIDRRIALFREKKFYSLAYALAKRHHKEELVEELLKEMPEAVAQRCLQFTFPPTSLGTPEGAGGEEVHDISQRPEAWPLLSGKDSFFIQLFKEPKALELLKSENLAATLDPYSQKPTRDHSSRGGGVVTVNQLFLPATSTEPGKINWGDDEEDEDEVFKGILHKASQQVGVGFHNYAKQMEGREDREFSAENGMWENDDGLDLDELLLEKIATQTAKREDRIEIERHSSSTGAGTSFLPIEPGPSLDDQWIQNVMSFHHQPPALLAAAGDFKRALALWKVQIGLINPEPLKPFLLQLWIAAHPSISLFSNQPNFFPFSATPKRITEHDDDFCAIPTHIKKSLPCIPNFLSLIPQLLLEAQRAMTSGQFNQSLTLFRRAIYYSLCCLTPDTSFSKNIMEYIRTAQEYIQALLVEIARKETDDPKKKLELSTYFTHFNLHDSHLVLILGQAMTQHFKAKNFSIAGMIARRLLDNPLITQEKADRASAVAQLALDKNEDAVPINYHPKIPFILCCVDQVPLYIGSVKPIRCSFCFAPADPKHINKPCPVCLIAALGVLVSGLVSVIS